MQNYVQKHRLCLYFTASELICKSVLKGLYINSKNQCAWCTWVWIVLFNIREWRLSFHTGTSTVTLSSSFPAVFRQFSKNAGNYFKSDNKWTLATRVWELKPFLPSTYISHLRCDIWKCIAAQLNMSEPVWQIWNPMSHTFSTLPFS